MPNYEYRCPVCKKVSNHFARITEKPSSIPCGFGCQVEALPIISRMNIQLSKLSKVERMDPKYDQMVDQAARSNPLADPDRYINRLGDPGKGSED